MGRPVPDSSTPDDSAAPRTTGGALQAFLSEGHAWVAALAAVAGVVVTAIIALNGSGQPPPPSGDPSISPVADTATASPTPTPPPTETATATPTAAPDHEIVASCVGCTPAEVEARQDAIDTLVARLAVIDGDSCTDTTDTFDGSPMARVGCTFAGGYNVDYILWPDTEAMASFTGLFTGIPESVILEWHLFGNSGPRTGDTVEWVQDGAARFYWTYDEFLISANASLTTGEQDRLNDWWRTTASLMRE